MFHPKLRERFAKILKHPILNISCAFLIIFGLSFLVLSVSICFVLVLGIRGRKNDLNDYKQESHKYRFLNYNGAKNEYTRGFKSVFETLIEDDFVSYQVERQDSHTLISNFGTIEYKCSGACFCDELSHERRGIISTSPTILTYFVAAISTTIALRIAGRRFEEMCFEEISETCNDPMAAVSSVSECEAIDNLEISDEDTSPSYFCTGHCIDKLKYLRSIPSESLTVTDSYEVENPNEEIFPRNKEEFDEWMKENHDSEDAVWVYNYKAHTKKKSANFDDLVEVALRYGWIDGGPYRKNEDKGDEVSVVRYTRRRKGSNWSQTNLKKARKMIRDGEMGPEGREEYDKWIENHPDDEESHCNRFELEKDVEIGKRGVKRLLKTRSFEEAVREKYMKELHRFCADISKTKKMKGGNKLKIRCVGHQELSNPSVKCLKKL